MQQFECYIVASVSVVLNIIAMFIALFFNGNSKPELISLFSGSVLLSISLFHIFPQAVVYADTSFPYYSLTAIITFTLLTLFSFVRDALKISDANILLPVDTILMQESFTSTSTERSIAVLNEPPKFSFKDNFAECFYYFAFIAQSLPYGAELKYIPLWKAILRVVTRMFEFIILGRLLRKMNISNRTYWILGMIACLMQPLSIFIPAKEGNLIIKWTLEILSSLLLGTYLFVSSRCIDDGIKITNDNTLLIAFVFIVGILIPALLKIGC